MSFSQRDVDDESFLEQQKLEVVVPRLLRRVLDDHLLTLGRLRLGRLLRLRLDSNQESVPLSLSERHRYRDVGSSHVRMFSFVLEKAAGLSN